MKYITLAAIACIAISGCQSAKLNSINRDARAQNATLQAEALKSAKHIQVGTNLFRVSTITGSYTAVVESVTDFNSPQRLGYSPGAYALVKRITPQTGRYTAQDVERAAQQATGCNAKINGGVLAFLGNVNSMDLNEIDSKVKTPVKGWRADLTC